MQIKIDWDFRLKQGNKKNGVENGEFIWVYLRVS